MASLSALPQELTIQVLQPLEISDKFSLGATCKYWRAQLAPEIFKTIRLTNNESLAESVLNAVEAHGQYTTTIELKAHCGLNVESTLPALPPAAVKVLQGHLTPNLKTVSVNFDFDFDCGERATFDRGTIYAFQDVETEEHVREREEAWQWRALMNEAWQALAANMHVRELIIKGFVLKWTSTFRSEEFRRLLSRLESASFDFIRMQSGVSWRTNRTEGWLRFVAELDASFFHHMIKLKHLAIIASDPIGLEGQFHVPLALKPGDLPLLESLKLRKCFAGPELLLFIQDHAQVLKSLDVKNCVGGGIDRILDNGITWAQFFDDIYEVKPVLTELIAGLSYINSEHELEPDHQLEDEPEIWEVFRQKLRADPSLRWLAYGHIHHNFGWLCLDDEINGEHFERGDDQRAFNRLMGLVNENAAKAKQ
ncbi:hypothetical protein ACQKWADRAFT_300215 [Trichoderma austrokoningii]